MRVCDLTEDVALEEEFGLKSQLRHDAEELALSGAR